MASEHGASVDGHVQAKSHTIKRKLRKKFQRKLECASCKEICKSPKQWECSHYFCSPCLDELTTTRRLPRRCPECENEIRASPDGRRAQELPPDAFLELLIEVFEEFRSQYQLDSEDESLECRGCKKRDAPVAYCCDCDNHFLCEGCRTQHENLTVFEGHCVEAMEDLDLESIVKQRARFCNVAGHEAKKLTLYCGECAQCICDDCKDEGPEGHAGHADRIKSVEAAADEFSNTIRQEVEKAKTKVDDLNEKIRAIVQIKNDVDRQHNECAGEIKDQSKKAQRESEGDELLEALRAECGKAKRLLNEQREQITRHKDQLNAIAASTEAFVKKAANIDILAKKTSLLKCLTTRAETEIDTRPAAQPNITFEPFPFPENSGVPGVLGKIEVNLHRPSQSTAEGIGLSSAFDGLKSEFVVTRRDGVGSEVYVPGEKPLVRFRSAADPSEVLAWELHITNHKNGNYTVSYFAKDPGSFKINISFNGEDIYKSPFALRVSPREFKCEQVFGCYGTGDGSFKGPWGVAVSSSDHIAISDNHNHRVQIFDAEGRFQKAIGAYGTGRGEFDCPFGIAYDVDENLLVVDSNNHRVQKFDKTGKYVMQFGRKGGGDGELNLPWSVSLDADNGNIIVSDKANNRIQIFSAEGKYLAKIRGSEEELLSFSIACVMSNHHYFVSDTNNHCIKIFTRDGDFLSKFGSEGQEPGELIKNQGLMVDKADNVVVCDSWNDRVQLFKLNADGLSVRGCRHFGCTGNQPGFLNDVSYVAMLSDGRFVVCDYRNHRVQIIA